MDIEKSASSFTVRVAVAVFTCPAAFALTVKVYVPIEVALDESTVNVEVNVGVPDACEKVY